MNTARTTAACALLAVACAAQPAERAEPLRSKQTASIKEKPAVAAKPTPAAVSPHADCTDALQLLLSAPHDPPTREQVDAACAAPDTSLVRVADDENELGLRRLRAVALLGAYDSTLARDALERALRAQLASVRRTAVVALAKHPAAPRRDALLRAALEDRDPHVRAETARVLKSDPAPATRAALARARDKETVPFVKALFE